MIFDLQILLLRFSFVFLCLIRGNTCRLYGCKTKSTQNIKNGIVTLGVFRRQLMDKVFLENMKTKLMEQKKTLLDSLADQSEDMKNLVKTVDSGDEADVAADVIDRQLLTSIGTQDAIRLQQIENALDRINQDKYGRCIKCGKEIPEERLEVLPYALMCIQCASAEERRNR